MHVHCLQHVDFEGIGTIGNWAAGAGHTLATTRLYANDPLEPVDAADLLVVMGGPMGVHDDDRFPWLARERRVIELAIARGRPVLGVCLGAQLVADVLGARVTRNPVKEIGWFPVEITAAARSTPVFAGFPDRLEVFHWHGDTFSLPPGAVHAARSDACEQQAYVWEGRVVGLQFHLEMTPPAVRRLVENCASELVAAPTIQSADEMLAPAARFGPPERAMHGLLDALARAA